MRPAMTISRRHFLRSATAVSLGFAGLAKLTGCASADWEWGADGEVGYGPLMASDNAYLELPEGFSCHLFSPAGQEMSDGLLVPGAHDGMAAFAGPRGRTILIRNHELVDSAGAFGESLERLDRFEAAGIYDQGRDDAPAMGGTTTLVYNTRRGEIERQYLSLAGTLRNCAGGPTPWNSWLSCEEHTAVADDQWDQDHGYVFEVPASDTIMPAAALPIKPMGRFNHEAVAVHPRSSIVYQTEDRGDGCIYRYIPHRRGRLHEGGRLQVLALRDQATADTRNWPENHASPIEPGQAMAVSWLDADDVLAPKDDLRLGGQSAGAAIFARGEGMWYGRGAVYFACTNGGPSKAGQIFRYVPSALEGTPPEQNEAPGTLELFIEPNDTTIVQNADNLTVAPWGDVILCEDGDGEDFMIGVTPNGQTYQLARNIDSSSELAGCCFSPDGRTLFVNIQSPGITAAITGPWRRRMVRRRS